VHELSFDLTHFLSEFTQHCAQVIIDRQHSDSRSMSRKYKGEKLRRLEPLTLSVSLDNCQRLTGD